MFGGELAEYLHASAQTKDEVKGGFLLGVVVREGAARKPLFSYLKRKKKKTYNIDYQNTGCSM
jgi:hypothetical protein